MKVFVAVPSLDDRVSSKCSLSLLQNTHRLRDEGHQIMPHFQPGCFIDVVRNICVELFLYSEYDELIMVDQDERFEPDAMLKVLKHDKEIIAGAVPAKTDPLRFVTEIDWGEDGNCKDEETGLIKAKKVGSGFIKIRRSAFDKMIDHYKMERNSDSLYEFFDTGTKWGRWYGEDIYFGKRWTDMGGKLYIEPNIWFTHIGPKEYLGNLHEYLMERRLK